MTKACFSQSKYLPEWPWDIWHSLGQLQGIWSYREKKLKIPHRPCPSVLYHEIGILSWTQRVNKGTWAAFIYTVTPKLSILPRRRMRRRKKKRSEKGKRKRKGRGETVSQIIFTKHPKKNPLIYGYWSPVMTEDPCSVKGWILLVPLSPTHQLWGSRAKSNKAIHGEAIILRLLLTSIRFVLSLPV